ncbi:hypothetical protein Tco_1152721 [Tanacetum coccineum]
MSHGYWRLLLVVPFLCFQSRLIVLKASVDKLFDEGGSENQTEQGDSAGGRGGVDIQPIVETTGIVTEAVAHVQPKHQRKRKSMIADTGEPLHPPKKLREDHGTPSGASVDYPIWEVIQNGNGPVSITTYTQGQIKILPPRTAEEILARERERKVRTTLLMALPEDHFAKFHKIINAKEMWEAIRSRFGGNDESKKMQKYILKQQFEGFAISNSEGLHKGYDRFQSLLSQLEIHGAGVSTEDVNQKFLRSLPSAWSQNDVKGSIASSSSTQNVAFVSENTSSTNDSAQKKKEDYSLMLATVYSQTQRDCDFHEKRMAKQAELNNRMRKKSSQREIRTIWNNVQRVNHKNQFVPTAVLTRTGKIPVNTARASGTNNVSTARHNFNSQAVLTNAARKISTVKPFVNRVRPKTIFHKTHSPFRRPFNNTTALRTNFSKQKVNTAEVNAVSAVGGKRETAVKPSAGCNWRPKRHYWHKVSKYNGGSSPRNYATFKDPLGRPKSKKAWLPDELKSYFRIPIPRQNNCQVSSRNIVPSGGAAGENQLATQDCKKVWILVDLPYGKKAIGNRKRPNESRLEAMGAIYNVVCESSLDGEIRLYLGHSRTALKHMASVTLRMPADGIVPDSNFGGVAKVETSRLRIVWKAAMRQVVASSMQYKGLILCLQFVLVLRFKSIQRLQLVLLRESFYPKGQTQTGLWYPRVSSFDLKAYSDSDYAGANLDRKSTTRGSNSGLLLLGLIIITAILGSSIYNALTVSPVVSTTFVEQFWMSAKKRKKIVPTRKKLVPTRKKIVPTRKKIVPIDQMNVLKEEVPTTPTPTPTTFGDDETIAQVLLNMSQAKAVSREKEKGVELKDVENIERPRLTSTRSLLTLKSLPKIDPKDKGKKKIEEDESDTESEDINETKKKFKMLAHDEEIARKMQEDWETEEERKRLAEEEATNAALIQDFDDIKARMEADRLLALRLQEEERAFTSLYEKVKMFNESFTVVSSTEDERKIKEMNEGAKDLEQKRLKKKVAIETPKKEDTIKVPAKVDVTEECLKIVTFEGTIDSDIMEKKSFIARMNKVSSPDGDYLVIYRANGNFRAFNYLLESICIYTSWLSPLAGYKDLFSLGLTGEIVPTLPFVTSSVFAIPEREDEDHTDSVTGHNLRTIRAPQRFVISSDSFHHSGVNVAEAEVDSLIRSSAPVMTAVTTTAPTTDPAVVVKEKTSKPSLFAADSSSAGGADPNAAPRQMSLSAKVRMRAKYNIKENRRLSELEVKVVDLAASVKVREQEVTDLDVVVTSVKSQNDSLVEQEKVMAYESCIYQLEKFQDEKMKEVNDKFDNKYVDFAEMALCLEEKFYPHLLTTIAGRRWLLTYDVKLVIVKCLHSLEYLSALGAAISKAIKKGLQDGLAARITYGHEGRVLTNVAAFNPFTKSDYVSALQELQDVNFSLLAELKFNKDTSVETLMNILRLEETLAERLDFNESQPHFKRLGIKLQPIDMLSVDVCLFLLAKSLILLSHGRREGRVPHMVLVASDTTRPMSLQPLRCPVLRLVPPISTMTMRCKMLDDQDLFAGEDTILFPNGHGCGTRMFSVCYRMLTWDICDLFVMAFELCK